MVRQLKNERHLNEDALTAQDYEVVICEGTKMFKWFGEARLVKEVMHRIGAEVKVIKLITHKDMPVFMDAQVKEVKRFDTAHEAKEYLAKAGLLEGL